MKRPLALLVVAVALLGCGRTNSLVPVDPFFGPTTVPPPRTGIRPSADPYYSNTRQATLPGRWSGQQPGQQSGAPRTATRPSVADRYQPPSGSFQFQGTSTEAMEPSTEAVATLAEGDRISIPSAARQDWDWSTMAAAGGGDDALSDLKSAGSGVDALDSTFDSTDDSIKIVKSLGPPPASRLKPRAGRSVSWDAASRVDPSVRQASSSTPIDIMDLPPVTSSDKPRSASAGGFVRPVSASGNDTGSVVRIPSQGNARFRAPESSAASPVVPRARFGFDPEYKSLRGKLEYSEIDRRWKLRYIPIDGTTDEFGGSVVLEETSRLAGCERGDFVEVHGQIAHSAEGDRGYAPNFKISRIERLSR